MYMPFCMDRVVWLLVKSTFIDKNLFCCFVPEMYIGIIPCGYLASQRQPEMPARIFAVFYGASCFLGLSFLCSDCKWGQGTQIHPSVLSGKWQEPNSLRLSSRNFHEWRVKYSGVCKHGTVIMVAMHKIIREVYVYMFIFVCICKINFSLKCHYLI